MEDFLKKKCEFILRCPTSFILIIQIRQSTDFIETQFQLLVDKVFEKLTNFDYQQDSRHTDINICHVDIKDIRLL